MPPDPANDLDLPPGCMATVAVVVVLGLFILITAIAWSLTRL